MGTVGFVFFIAALGLLVVLLVGAAMARGAVALANRLIGSANEEPLDPVDDWDWDAEPDEPPARRRKKRAIPGPGIGKGALIAFVVNLLTAVAGYTLGLVAEGLAPEALEEWGWVVLVLITLQIGFVGLILILVVLLPTTFWRAALVAFLYHIIGLIILMVLAGCVFVASWITGL